MVVQSAVSLMIWAAFAVTPLVAGAWSAIWLVERGTGREVRRPRHLWKILVLAPTVYVALVTLLARAPLQGPTGGFPWREAAIMWTCSFAVFALFGAIILGYLVVTRPSLFAATPQTSGRRQ